jgi:phytanoyl-CoA hydroxylase
MLSFLKRLRFIYGLYNFFHKKQLVHNLPVYEKYGLDKKYYSSISSKDFKQVNGNSAEVSVNDIHHTKAFQQLSAEDQRSLKEFDIKGYAILKRFFSEQQMDEVNQTIDQLLNEKKVQFKYGRKIMFAYKKSEALEKIGKDQRLMEILSSLIGTRAVLFQSINFLQGSEQHTHSDSIHMTTFPLGKLIAVWVALEDIYEDNGPLHYYPGSHLLPYYLNSDYDNEGSRLLIGDKSYTAYEEMIEKKIRESGLKKEIFLAKKGDILIWHANLSHGGEPHANKNRTRKSMVFHYFGEDAICYHEITQRPALMDLG